MASLWASQMQLSPMTRENLDARYESARMLAGAVFCQTDTQFHTRLRCSVRVHVLSLLQHLKHCWWIKITISEAQWMLMTYWQPKTTFLSNYTTIWDKIKRFSPVFRDFIKLKLKVTPSVHWCCWLDCRKSIWPVKNLSDKVLAMAWSSVWSEVQMTCIWSSWCHCYPIMSASAKSRMVYPFGTGSPG